jgi:hypothetical protein
VLCTNKNEVPKSGFSGRKRVSVKDASLGSKNNEPSLKWGQSECTLMSSSISGSMVHGQLQVPI